MTYDIEEKNPHILLPDALWQKIEPLLPQHPQGNVGRPRMDDRKALTAMYYILRTGIQWRLLPSSLGAKSTVHDRFQYWQSLGILENFWKIGLEYYDRNVGVDFLWQAMDGCHCLAPIGGDERGPSYKHRGKKGVNRSLITDKNGIPLGIFIAPANKNDFLLARDTFNSFKIQRPDPLVQEQHLSLDKGYDNRETDALLLEFGYISHIRRTGEPDIPPENRVFPPRRWVVERSHAWINHFRSLATRYSRYARNYLAMVHFACGVICFRSAKLIRSI